LEGRRVLKTVAHPTSTACLGGTKKEELTMPAASPRHVPKKQPRDLHYAKKKERNMEIIYQSELLSRKDSLGPLQFTSGTKYKKHRLLKHGGEKRHFLHVKVRSRSKTHQKKYGGELRRSGEGSTAKWGMGRGQVTFVFDIWGTAKCCQEMMGGWNLQNRPLERQPEDRGGGGGVVLFLNNKNPISKWG